MAKRKTKKQTVDIGAAFEPCADVRQFDSRKFVGKMATIRLLHTNVNEKRTTPTNQYVVVEFRGMPPYLNLSGWAGRYLGEPKTAVKRRITDMFLIGHRNGGRDHRTSPTYAGFFDDQRKERVKRMWAGGLMCKILSGGEGDIDQADVIVSFSDFEIDSMSYEFCAPEEWYSELYEADPRFRFSDGFYPDADQAIKVFSDKAHDDLFGERYFPVIVFPVERYEEARNIAHWATGYSKPIIVKNQIIFGTRCKPDQYQSMIEETYKLGGKVPVGVQWDWQE